MENKAGKSSSSDKDMPPPPPTPTPPSPPPTMKIEDDIPDMTSAGLEDPSNVRNLTDILNFTTQMTDTTAQKAPSSTTVNSAMAEEKKKFLSNILSNMSVNVHGEMRNSINILLDTEKDEEEYLHAFDVIAEFVDNIDFANDFQKLGGFMVIESGLLSPYNTVKCKTADLIGVLVQNNPYCQNKFIEYPTYINLLMKLVETDLDNKVCVKALHAISCLVRENVSAFWKFINLGGDKLILYSLNSSNKKLKIKAAFLIFSTSHMGNDIADMYVDNGVVEILCTVILTMKNALEHFHHELFLSTLNQLLTMSPTRVKDICTSFEDFKDVLVSIQDSYTHDDANYQEERDQILWLIESLTIVKE